MPTSYVIRRNGFRKRQSAEVRKKCLLRLKYGYFLTKMHGLTTGGLYSSPGAVWGTFYYGCAHFISRLLNCWQKTPAYPNERLGGARTIFYITLIGFVWKKSYTPRMPRGWVHHRLIFIFGWTNPLKNQIFNARLVFFNSVYLGSYDHNNLNDKWKTNPKFKV